MRYFIINYASHVPELDIIAAQAVDGYNNLLTGK